MYRVKKPTGEQRLEGQVRRFRREMEARGATPDAVAHYTEYRQEITRLEDAAKSTADRLGRVPLCRRMHLVVYARKLYAVSRRVERRFWPEAMANLTAAAVRSGLDRDTLVEVLSVCWFLLSGSSAPGNLGQLVDEALVRNTEGVMSEDSTKKSRPKKAKREASDRDVASAGKQTPLESYSRKRALESLRFALAMHQPVVKRCVLLRLIKRYSFDALAKELELSLEEVNDILSRMRAWVLRYTCYFEDEWYWTQSGKKYLIPGAGPAQPAA